MKRVCFLGNSHIASIKLGIDLAQTERGIDDCQVDLFASPGHTLASCAVIDDAIVPTNDQVRESFRWTSGGQDVVKLRAYDDIYFIGGRSPYFLGLYIPDSVTVPPMGRACIEAAARYWCSDWFQDLTAAAARAAPWVRFHFVGKPFLSKASPFGTRVHGELAHDDSGIIKDRLANLRTKIDQAVWDLPSHFASIIRPPPHVLDATGSFTRDQYSRGAIRLTEDYNNPHPDTDYAHMNGQYGRDLVNYLLVDLHRAKETSGCAAVAAADAVR